MRALLAAALSASASTRHSDVSTPADWMGVTHTATPRMVRATFCYASSEPGRSAGHTNVSDEQLASLKAILSVARSA